MGPSLGLGLANETIEEPTVKPVVTITLRQFQITKIVISLIVAVLMAGWWAGSKFQSMDDRLAHLEEVVLNKDAPVSWHVPVADATQVSLKTN